MDRVDVVPTLEEIAERLPDSLIRHSLYDHGGFCPLGFVLHELGVPEEILSLHAASLEARHVPEPLRQDGDERVILVSAPTLLNRVYPAVSVHQFYDIMRLNDFNTDDSTRVTMAREALRQLSRDGELRSWTEDPYGVVKWDEEE